jgi:peptide/nickel transport system permease protein
MKRILFKRLLWSIFVIWAVTSLAFVINNVLPGDPARMVAGPQARASDVAAVRARLGLDQPLAVQYGIFMRRLVGFGPSYFERGRESPHRNCEFALPLYPTGRFVSNDAPAAERGKRIWMGLHVDFGRSFSMRQPVASILAERLPRTAALALVAVLAQLLLGVTTGVLAAVRKQRATDHAAVGISLLGISAPTFLIGIAAQYLFAYKLRLLPFDGFGSSFGEHAACIVLPALTLGVYGAAYYTRLVRDEMIGVLDQDYVRTARAKGLPEWRVVLRHALRNALVPLATVVGLDLGALMGGAIVTETIFRWPGLGQLSVQALLNRDGPVIVGAVVVTSTAIVLANLLVDLCYASLDPRVRR